MGIVLVSWQNDSVETEQLPRAWQGDLLAASVAWQRVQSRAHVVPGDWAGLVHDLQDVEESLRRTGSWAKGPHDLMGILWLTNDEVRLCRVLA